MSSGPGEDPLQSLKAEFSSSKENSELYDSFESSGIMRGEDSTFNLWDKNSEERLESDEISQK
jgi:hypothetical protein